MEMAGAEPAIFLTVIDTHCHLDAAEFGDRQADLAQAAIEAGVQQFVVPSVGCGNFAAVAALCRVQPRCAPAYGIHPLYAAGVGAADFSLLGEYLARPDTVAVGEIGLDGTLDEAAVAEQEACFIAQLKLAREQALPVLLHIRQAQDWVLKCLRRYPVRGGIAHAFNGSRQQAEAFIALGFKLGFGGALTYSRATRLHELARTLPLSSLVLETDAPDIPPAFLERGQPNEPRYLPRIAAILAELRGLPLNELLAATRANTYAVLPRLPRIDPP